tara:strand:+ start:326 stop:988 length:663 start_codon:yes stop_codon:yes gene_type:complete
MKYEIQHETWIDGWVNTSTTEDADGNEIPLVFDSRKEAQEEIDDLLGEIADQIKSGERAADEGYDPDEYRVREVAPVSDLDNIMSRTNFDYADMENAFELGVASAATDLDFIDEIEGSSGYRLGVISAAQCFASATLTLIKKQGDQIYEEFDWYSAIANFAAKLNSHFANNTSQWASLNHGRGTGISIGGIAVSAAELQDQFELEVTKLATLAIQEATWK